MFGLPGTKIESTGSCGRMEPGVLVTPSDKFLAAESGQDSSGTPAVYLSFRREGEEAAVNICIPEGDADRLFAALAVVLGRTAELD